MLFWLKKTATIPFLPLYFSLLVGLVGLLLLFRKRHAHLGRVLVLLSLGTLLAASNKGVALLLLQPLEHTYAAIPEVHRRGELPLDVARCTAIVVLGGGHARVSDRSRVNQLSTASMSRIGEAVRLARLLPEAKFVVSGHDTAELSHAQVLAEAAMSLGIAPERIVRMDEPWDTEDEINGLKRRFGAAPVAIVTSAWHMPRVMELCRAIGVNGVPCPANFVTENRPPKASDFFTWELESLEASTKAVHERVGAVWLKLRGR